MFLLLKFQMESSMVVFCLFIQLLDLFSEIMSYPLFYGAKLPIFLSGREHIRNFFHYS